MVTGRMDRLQINLQKAAEIRLLLTDSDGVLTDTGVYYSARGEELKRFSIRDGMGVARLRDLAEIETGIITGENSPAVRRRAEKLKIRELHLGIQDKLAVLKRIAGERRLELRQIAYIGDDYNDLETLKAVGLSASPGDAIESVKNEVDYVCRRFGGYGAFRELAEFIIQAKIKDSVD